MLKAFLVKNKNKIKYNFNVNYEELNHQCMKEMNLFLLNDRNLILEEKFLINEKFKEENIETELLCKSIADIQKIVNDLKENKLKINDEVLISKEKLLTIAYENILLNNYYYELKKNMSFNFYFEQYKTCFIPSDFFAIWFGGEKNAKKITTPKELFPSYITQRDSFLFINLDLSQKEEDNLIKSFNQTNSTYSIYSNNCASFIHNIIYNKKNFNEKYLSAEDLNSIINNFSQSQIMK